MRKYYEPVPRGEHRPWQERLRDYLPTPLPLAEEEREALFQRALDLEAQGRKTLALMVLERATR